MWPELRTAGQCMGEGGEVEEKLKPMRKHKSQLLIDFFKKYLFEVLHLFILKSRKTHCTHTMQKDRKSPFVHSLNAHSS